MKSKFVAATLAFFLGIFGTHRFYLGQRALGVLYGFIFFITAIISFENDVPALAFPAILAFVDSVLFAVMPKEEFDERYNQRFLRPKRRRRERADADYGRLPQQTPPYAHRPTLSELKRSGIEKFREYDFDGAIDDFLQALDIEPEDPATHFNLACSYSILEDEDGAFDHLDLAVANGFNQFDKIKNHDALSYIRTLPKFDEFVKNDYRLPETDHTANNEEPAEELKLRKEKPDKAKPNTPPEEQLTLEDELLDQIIKLGKLRDKGILTEEEFMTQKQKILERR